MPKQLAPVRLSCLKHYTALRLGIKASHTVTRSHSELQSVAANNAKKKKKLLDLSLINFLIKLHSSLNVAIKFIS